MRIIRPVGISQLFFSLTMKVTTSALALFGANSFMLLYGGLGIGKDGYDFVWAQAAKARHTINYAV
jgi:hypothetical protein